MTTSTRQTRQYTERTIRLASILLAVVSLAVIVVQATPLTGNGRIAFYRTDAGGPPQLWVMDPDGNNPHPLISVDWAGPSAWSPDGTHIAFTIGNPFCAGDPTCLSQNGLWVMDAATLDRTKLGFTGAHPSWSPDGTQLAVSAGGNIWVINVDGSGSPQQLTTDGFQNVFPTWSPDGTQIAYQHQRRFISGSGFTQCCDQIWVVNTDPANPNPHVLSDETATAVVPGTTIANAFDYLPKWSPDGTRILFETSRADPNSPTGGRVQAWLMDADGDNQHAVSTNTFNEIYPAWSPDGTKIVFASDNKEDPECGQNLTCDYELYTMTATGQNVTRLTFNQGLDIYPAWQPVAGGSDTTPPTVDCVGPDATVWHNANVSVACNASDGGSGLNDTANDANFALVTTVGAGTEDANALTTTHPAICDVAGNCRPSSGSYGPLGPFKIDRKPPTITIATPASNRTFLLAEPAAASYSCSDGGSDVATCVGSAPSGSLLNTQTVGARTFTVNASDNVGNAAIPASNSYTVSFGVQTMQTHKTVNLRLVNFFGANVSSPSIVLTVTTIDGQPVTGQVFALRPNGSYKYSPLSLTRGPHALEFVATGDPTPHVVNFTM